MINTLKHLAFVLKVELSEIESIIQNIDKFYYEKVEIKLDKNGQPKTKNGNVQKRILNPSINRLKIIQERVQKKILQNIEIPDYAYGGIKKKDNIKNAKKHQGKKFNFTTDLKSFYPSISNKNVFEMFRSFSFSPTVSRQLTKLTTYKGKLPQGTPTSPLIANLVFIKTGKKLQNFAKENNLTFTSFVDDLTFSAPHDFKEKAHNIIDIILSDGFKISHNKTFYKTKNPIVTGIVVKNNKLSNTNSFKIKIQIKEGKTEAQIKGLNQYAERIKKTNITKNNIYRKNSIEREGFTTIPSVYSDNEIKKILSTIDSVHASNSNFRKTKDLFAIRQFLKEIPAAIPLIFNEKLKVFIKEIFGEDYFVIKSIYFDKTEQSNWFVAYHQDLTISVDKKKDLENFGPWTVKQNQFAAQPPIEILQAVFTIRIHLDDTNENNGALKVIPGSHIKGVYRSETIDWTKEKETICKVEKGGIMIMKPLLLHSSSRSTNNDKRRVIHIEFCNQKLPEGLNWSEFLNV